MNVVVHFGLPDHPMNAQVMEEGRQYIVTMPTTSLFSAGQYIPVQMAVQSVPTPPRPEPGDRLFWAPEISGIVVDPTWDMSWLPSNRSLADILTEVVKHTEDYPTHGATCVCMDQYSREIRLHLRKAMPPDTRPLHRGWPDAENQEVVRVRVMAQQRIHHVLNMVLRNF